MENVHESKFNYFAKVKLNSDVFYASDEKDEKENRNFSRNVKRLGELEI
jgi:hypothetical protein